MLRRGLNCNIILLIYYGAPLSMIVKVVRTKSSSALHFPMVLANFVNGSMWFMYGLWVTPPPPAHAAWIAP